MLKARRAIREVETDDDDAICMIDFISGVQPCMIWWVKASAYMSAYVCAYVCVCVMLF